MYKFSKKGWEKMDDDDYSEDEMMGFYDDPMDEAVDDELDDVEFPDDEEAEREDDDVGNEDQDVDDLDADSTVEEDEKISESDGNKLEVGYCHICGAEVIVDELPDTISRDAFEQFGLCLNCQWGIFMDNGGHF
jgi:hypothetical protein